MKIEINEKLLIILFINIPLLFLNLFIYVFALESLGNNNLQTNFYFKIWSIYIVFALIHVGLNLLLLRGFKMLYRFPIIVSIAEIFTMYLLCSFGIDRMLFAL